MSDAVYKEYPFLFASKGVIARKVDDTATTEEFLALTNCEELAENAIAGRLGSTVVNAAGTIPGAVFPLSASVIQIAKLGGLSGQAWRYAGTSDGNLYRRAGLNPGAYSLLSSSLSGSPFWAVSYRPEISSFPYIFIADANGMFKDNGSFSSLLRMGIFQPQYPVVAQVQNPDQIILDNYQAGAGVYTYTGIGGGSIVPYVNTTTTSTSLIFGLQQVDVADPTQISQFQLVTLDAGNPGEETVLVLTVNATGFMAVIHPHASGITVTSKALSVTVPAATTATVSLSFGGTPISAWPTTLSLSDYIALHLFASDPTQIKSITLKFDCGDGSFNTDYFYKVIAQGPQQQLLEAVNDPTTAATDNLLSESLGLYNNSSSGIEALQSGLDVWTPLLMQLSDFASAGRADFGDPVYNWQNVNGYQIQIVTNDQSSVTVELSSLLLFGGSGADSLGGVAYDYVFTLYNANDGTESNPCVVMSNVNPPNQTNWVYPRRQPVKLTLQWTPNDSQVTHLRIYRRGGTLGDNFRRIDQVISNGFGLQHYIDVVSDAQLGGADIVSLTNDVPVTSTLPVPVDTTLSIALTIPSPFSPQAVTPVSMANISVGQLVTIGSPTDPANNFEIVVVTSITVTTFFCIIQNNHAIGESIQATAAYGQPVNIMAQAYNQMWYAGDPNNPHFLYYSAGNNPQAVSSAAHVEVGTPDDPITVILQLKGNLYVSTKKFWWAIAPGSNANAQPTVYPTAAKHGCIAPFGFVVTEEGVYFQSCDGIRFFAGGASEYLTQNVEFLFQGIGTTPIVQADQTQLSKTVMAYWNNMIFCAYVGLDGNRHRLVYHSVYKRIRNDDVDAQCLLLEADTNTLVFGDSQGYVHIDRQNLGYDQGAVAGSLAQVPIAINMQSSYNNQGGPDFQKNYQELTLDVNTAGQTLTATLLFEDGQVTQVIGTFSNAQRGKINFVLNNGLGFSYYKVALQITGNLLQQAYLYQGAIKALPLAKTRKSFDTYQLRLGYDGNKIAKDCFFEYTASAIINVQVFYDASSTVGFPFTLPANGGVRSSQRVRLPAVSFKMIRFVATSSGDFQIWGDETAIECKAICQGKGYQKMPFMPN